MNPAVARLGHRATWPRKLLLLFRVFAQHGLELFNERARILELTVDAGEAHVGDLIELAQVLHHEFAEPVALDFTLEVGVKFVLDRGHDRFDLLIADRSLPAGLFQAALDLAPLEGNARAVFLHDLDRDFLDPFVGRVTPLAGETFSTTTNGETILAGSRVDDPIIVDTAKRTIHESVLGSWCLVLGR